MVWVRIQLRQWIRIWIGNPGPAGKNIPSKKVNFYFLRKYFVGDYDDIYIYRTGSPGYIGWQDLFIGINSGPHIHLKIRALAGRYDKRIPTRCQAPIDFFKIPALVSVQH
jgi:hypothetical protein